MTARHFGVECPDFARIHCRNTGGHRPPLQQTLCYDRSLSMTPERWKKIDEVYNEALDRDPATRRLFLDEACQGDDDLRREVDSLLAASIDAPTAFNRPALEVEAEALARESWFRKTPDPLPPLGSRYVALAEAGRGGMGIVYRARDVETEEIVAIKVLHPEVASDPLMLERFRSELKLARRVTHHHVCRIYDMNRANDLVFISMEFVEGESLRRVLNRMGALGVKKAAALIRQVSEGLREVHAQRIIHRDLKPENIMIDAAGNARIMDFGIARQAGSQKLTIGVAGTPSYMAPEQMEGGAPDERSDIYALGLIAYEMLTGRAAFAGSTPVAVAAQQMRAAPPAPRTIDPAIPPELEAVVMRCIATHPSRRFQSVDELLVALAPYDTPSSTPAPSGRKPSRISGIFDETAQIMAPRRARYLLIFIQLGYLALYLAVLYNLDEASAVLERRIGLSATASWILPLSAIGGVAVRFYLLSALTFNHPATGRQYWRLFPLLLAFDALWAASPLLVFHHLGIGLALAAMAAMAYLPFTQKTLFSNAYL
ncbi:MAG TPA: serine/threonine-protein kinase [Terriglobia bacterium]|nr:serine/threonine-protein kinase [Terriglobia bacterium]